MVSTFATNAFVLAQTASLSASIYLTDATQSNRLNIIESKYATTGSNTFVGNQLITGSLILSSSVAVELTVIGNSILSGSLEATGPMIYSGSVRGQVFPLTITSQTASLDASIGNFFTLTLVNGLNTYLTATNIRPGETIALKIKQPSGGYGTLSYSTSYKFSEYFPYVATPVSNAEDILSMQSYDTSSLYTVAINKLQ